MTTLEIIQRIMANADDPSAVEAIVKQAWVEDCEDFFVGLDLATNPIYDYGLPAVPEIQDEEDGDPGTLTFAHFHNVALNLAHSNLNFEQRNKVVEDCAMVANITEWNLWYRRILLKNLHIYFPMDAIKAALLSLTAEGPMLEQNSNPQGD